MVPENIHTHPKEDYLKFEGGWGGGLKSQVLKEVVGSFAVIDSGVSWVCYLLSHEITNEPYMSSNYENTDEIMTTDLTTSYDAETNTSDVEKIKNLCEQNFEGEANNKQLDIEDILNEAT